MGPGGKGPGGKGPGGMMENMGSMGPFGPKPIYPALMELPDLPLEKRAEVEARAHERMSEAVALMDTALVDLAGAAGRDDYPAMQAASAHLSQAVGQFDSGLAAHRALAEGQAPRNIALQWFKRDMNLLQVPASAAPHGVFGLSTFHYLTMAIVAAFALILAGMARARQRRTAQLLQRLMSAPETAATPAPVQAAVRPPAPASTLGGWSGALRIAEIFQETADVKTFRFKATTGDDLPFSFEPGQFLTVSAPIDGKIVRRSYTISSSPCCHGWCEITVKHAPGGVVSGYLHTQARVSDVIDASGPYGRFTFRGREAPNVVMIAGGVGITPMMSSIRYLTDQSWAGEIFLVYACNKLDDVIFREELDHLARRYANLHVTLVLSDPPADWTGPSGYITAELLQGVVPDLLEQRVHLCGSPPMMAALKGALTKAGLPAEQLKTEQFLTPEVPKSAKPAVEAEPSAAVNCRFARSDKTGPIGADQTVLEAAEAAGLSLDYSCREGFCGVCKCRLLEGSVSMAVEDGLAPADKAAGYILSCQAKATQNIVVDV